MGLVELTDAHDGLVKRNTYKLTEIEGNVVGILCRQQSGCQMPWLLQFLCLPPLACKHVNRIVTQSSFCCCAAELVQKQKPGPLPLGSHSSTISAIVKDAQKEWPSYAQTLVKDVAMVLESLCHKLCTQYFCDYPGLAELMR
jgi:hypothetical protein